MANKEEDDFYSFDEALDELRLKEEELKRLVSEGEIRAFREGETMRLRKRDVDSLRNELSGAVVEMGGSGDELVFEDDADLDAGMATEEISEADTILDDIEDVGEVEMDDEPVEEVVPVRTSRRTQITAAEEADEGTGMKAMAILTAVLLLAGLPIIFALGSGQATGLAKAIAGIFGGKFE